MDLDSGKNVDRVQVSSKFKGRLRVNFGSIILTGLIVVIQLRKLIQSSQIGIIWQNKFCAIKLARSKIFRSSSIWQL